MAIICSCVPAIKPLFVKIFPRILTSLSDSGKRSGSGNSEQYHIHPRSHDNTSGVERGTEPDIYTERPRTRGIEVQIQRSYELGEMQRNRSRDVGEKSNYAVREAAWRPRVYQHNQHPWPQPVEHV